jgi:flagellar biosynthesis protein FliQ
MTPRIKLDLIERSFLSAAVIGAAALVSALTYGLILMI